MWPLLTTRVLSVFVFLLADFSWVTRSVCTCRLTLPSREGGGPKTGGNQCHLDGSCTPIHTPGPWQLRPGSPVSRVPWKRAGASSRAKGSLRPSMSSWRSVSVGTSRQEEQVRQGPEKAPVVPWSPAHAASPSKRGSYRSRVLPRHQLSSWIRGPSRASAGTPLCVSPHGAAPL